ncbi:MAG: fibronectin type III domain-containing protein [Endomicrobiales bacterium]|nr:fibronectin type III domain-containing protein [Endomicrobiales bacterium]
MKKYILLFLAILLSAVFIEVSCFAEEDVKAENRGFKFGLINAVKDARDQLDKVYIRQGGPIPTPPTNISAFVVSPTQIRLTWTDTSNNEFGFRVKRRPDENSSFTLVSDLAANTTSYLDSGLIPSKTYRYIVVSYNGTGESSYSEEVSAQTPALTITEAGTYNPTNKNVSKACVSGDYAYLACGGGGLEVVDISSPSAIILAGALGSITANNIFVSGSHACIANGFITIDVTNPSSPNELGMLEDTTIGNVNDIYVSGNYAYVASDIGFRVVDISDPDQPTHIGGIGVSYNFGLGVHVSGNYAYYADGDNGFKIFDISDPSNPNQVGQLRTYRSSEGDYSPEYNLNATCVYAAGDYAYVGNNGFSQGGLLIINVSDPSNPQVEGGFYDNFNDPNDIYVKGNLAFVVRENVLKIISVADPANPKEVGSKTMSDAQGVYFYGDTIYVSDTSDGLRLLTTNISFEANELPTAPADLKVASSARGRINLTWIDNSSNEAGFKIERKTSTDSSYAEIATASENAVSYTDTSISEGTSYYYRIRAYNSKGNSEYTEEAGPVSATSTAEVGWYNTPGTAYNVYVSSNYAYVADGTGGLQIIDISDPTSPSRVGYYTEGTTIKVYDVCVQGDYAYIVDSNYKLKVIDVSDPAAPAALGYYSMTNAYAVYVSGIYAYVLTENYCYVLNISDPSSVLYHTQYAHNTGSSNIYGYGIDVLGDYIYQALDSNGFKVHKLSGDSLSQANNIDGTFYDVFVYGDQAYTVGTAGLQIYDVTDPSSPSTLSMTPKPAATYSNITDARKVFVKEGYAYVAADSHGMKVINCTNTSSLTEAASYDTAGTAYGVFVVGDYTYIADGERGLVVCKFGLSSSDSVAPAAPQNLEVITTSTTYVNLRWQDNAENESGYKIARSTYNGGSFDTIVGTISANSTSFTDEDLLPVTSYYYKVCAYNSSGNSSFSNMVRACTRPLHLMRVSYVTNFRNFNKIKVINNIAYVTTDNNYGMVIYDVSDPTSPQQLGVFDSGTSYYGIAVSTPNNIAYVGYSGGFKVVDISISTSPVESNDIGTAAVINYDMYIDGIYLYIAMDTSGLMVYDITAAAAPVVIADADGYNTPGNATGVHVQGNYAYIADGAYGMYIIDISNKSSLTYQGAYDNSYLANGIFVSGSYAYLSDSTNGLRIYDVSNPSTPNPLSSHDTASSAMEVYVRGNYAFVTSSDAGLYIFDVSDPSAPRCVGYNNTVGSSRGLAVSGDYIFIGDSTYLTILKITDSLP